MSKDVLTRKLIGNELDESTATHRQKKVWALAATGIGLDGYDLFIMSAALPLIMSYFGQTSAWMSALFAGAAVLGAVPGALLSGILSDKFGRRNILRLDVAMFGATAVLCAIAWNPASLIVFRFFQGFAVGAEYPISASMVAEVMPRANRGKWMTGAFAFQAVGMVAAAFLSTALLFIFRDDSTWRWMLLSCAVPSAIIAVMRRSIPESPRWLARKARMKEAEESLDWLLGPEAVANVQRQVAAARTVDEVEPKEGSIKELFHKSYRARTTLTAAPWFIMDIALYGIGIFTPVILASLIHTPAASSANAFIAGDLKATATAAIADIFLVIGFIINIYSVERAGRIRLQILGFIGMAHWADDRGLHRGRDGQYGVGDPGIRDLQLDGERRAERHHLPAAC
ncbi:MAG: MFS transporter [Actinomycetes bacterium]